MEQKKVIRDFKVLTEQISPDNVAVMAELIAMRETKALIGYYGYYAEKAHKNLCRDIFGKHESGYIFSDSYDFVQSVALFLCDHFGEHLDDVLYISKKGKPRTIKIECYRIVTRMLARGHNRMSGLSYPEIAKLLSRAVSTVYEYFEKMRARYSAIYG